MDFTAILIGLGIIITLFIIGKIFSILTKIFIVILIIAALAIGFFIWQKNNIMPIEKSINIEIINS